MASELKLFDNSGSSPLALTLSFGGRVLWTHCGVSSSFEPNHLCVCKFSVETGGSVAWYNGPRLRLSARAAALPICAGCPRRSRAGRQMAFQEHQLSDQWIREG